MISNMHFKDIKGASSMNKSKKTKKKRIKYMKNENIMIKTNIHIQRVCLTDFAIRNAYRTNYATFTINTLNLKVKVRFSQISPLGLSIVKGPFT